MSDEFPLRPLTHVTYSLKQNPDVSDFKIITINQMNTQPAALLEDTMSNLEDTIRNLEDTIRNWNIPRVR